MTVLYAQHDRLELSRARVRGFPIAVLAAHVGVASPTPDEDLLEALEAVPDPRRARGTRYRLVTVLAVSVAAVLAGACSYVAIAE